MLIINPCLVYWSNLTRVLLTLKMQSKQSREKPASLSVSSRVVNGYTEWNLLIDQENTITGCYQLWPWTKWLCYRKHCRQGVTVSSLDLMRSSFWPLNLKKQKKAMKQMRAVNCRAASGKGKSQWGYLQHLNHLLFLHLMTTCAVRWLPCCRPTQSPT